MDFRIYPLKDTSRLPELCELFAKGLGETTPEWWIWKNFTENGLPESAITVAEDENGKLQGMYSLQPVWYRRGDERILLVQNEGLIIAPECRGQGLMRKLIEYDMGYCCQLGAEALIGFSCNERSFPILTKYGAKDMGNIRSLATPKSMVSKFWRKRYYNRGGWKIQVSDTMPRDLFFTERDTEFKLEKNLRFMEWKFVEHPHQHYQWLTIRRDGVLEGYLVFYVNKGRLRNAVNICDWELRDSVDQEILRKAVGILQCFGNWVTLWGRQSEADRRRWQASGLSQTSGREDYFYYMPVCNQIPPSNWSVTKADSDN